MSISEKTNESVTPLLNAKEAYPAMLKAIKGSKDHVFFGNFSWRKGKWADKFGAELKKAAERGVSVKLLVDDYGSDLYDDESNDLILSGVMVARFHPFRPHKFWQHNNRTHKKLLIVDGKVGFTGGIGVGDFWVDKNAKYPAGWRDTHFTITGPAVADMAASFKSTWNASSRLPIDISAEATEPKFTAKHKIVAINSGPVGFLQMTMVGREMIDLIDSAKKTVTATMAYFGPNEALMKSLLGAAKRGVKVRLLINGPHTTHHNARQSGRHRYRRLIAKGIEIYEYQPTKIHCKILIVDNKICFIGSANMNFRSLYHDEEFNLIVNDPEVALQLNRHFAQDLRHSLKITEKDFTEQPLKERLEEAVASLGRYFF